MAEKWRAQVLCATAARVPRENVKSAKRNISHRHKTVHRSTGKTCRDALHKICELFEIMTVTWPENASTSTTNARRRLLWDRGEMVRIQVIMRRSICWGAGAVVVGAQHIKCCLELCSTPVTRVAGKLCYKVSEEIKLFMLSVRWHESMCVSTQFFPLSTDKFEFLLVKARQSLTRQNNKEHIFFLRSDDAHFAESLPHTIEPQQQQQTGIVHRTHKIEHNG